MARGRVSVAQTRFLRRNHDTPAGGPYAPGPTPTRHEQSTPASVSPAVARGMSHRMSHLPSANSGGPERVSKCSMAQGFVEVGLESDVRVSRLEEGPPVLPALLLPLLQLRDVSRGSLNGAVAHDPPKQIASVNLPIASCNPGTPCSPTVSPPAPACIQRRPAPTHWK